MRLLPAWLLGAVEAVTKLRRLIFGIYHAACHGFWHPRFVGEPEGHLKPGCAGGGDDAHQIGSGGIDRLYGEVLSIEEVGICGIDSSLCRDSSMVFGTVGFTT